MKRIALATLPALALLAAAGSAPAVADRAPTAEERSRIESVLRSAGYKSWEEIEFDDNLWEVDDAVDADGKQWDLKLDPGSMTIVRRVQD